MITYQVDQASLQRVQRKLGTMQSKAPIVISRALNKTAVSARQRLATRAQAAYTVKSGGFKKDMQIKKASSGNLVAEIRSQGKPLKIVKFKYSASSSGAKADITKSGLKPLIMGNIKAFRATMKSGHSGIFQRRSAARLPIKELYSNSIPKMIGSEKRVYGIVKPNIESDLRKYMEAQIKLLVG